MTDDQLKLLLEAAAETGARKALASVGLHDEKAAEDMRDLRDWLRNVQSLKSEFVRSIGRAIGFAFVGIMTIGLSIWSGLHNHFGGR